MTAVPSSRRRRHCLSASSPPAWRSSESKRECLNSRVEEFDLEGAIFDPAGLPYQLIEPVLGDGAVALRVGIHPMILTRCGPVEPHSESHRLSVRRGAEHEVKVPGVKAEDDLAGCGDQRRMLTADIPLPAQGPLIDGQP